MLDNERVSFTMYTKVNVKELIFVINYIVQEFLI